MRKTLVIFLLIFLVISCRSQPELIGEIDVEPGIEIIEPEFEIVSIVILQADIVVTEFEAVLRITNPNEFALEVSSITYQLYGNGALWASGTEIDVLTIPPLKPSETRFRFTMNFIDMRRSLLDDVIAMRQIQYNFRGEAIVQPDLPNVEAFLMRYDCTGYSEVRRNIDR